MTSQRFISAMQYKDLLVVVDRKPTATKRLETAFELARALDAHLTALLMIPEPANPVIAGVPMPLEILENQRELIAKEAADTIATVRSHADRAGIPLETRTETASFEQWPSRLARQARHADLTIIGQVEPEEDDSAEVALMIEAAFMQSGRPALVVPYVGARNLPPERILVCWDGSPEAARALNDSLPIIESARSTTLLIIDPEKYRSTVGELPGADAATHLARHGINVQIRTVTGNGMATGEVILNEISDNGADLVVMGGYGHSRLREMVLGGATRKLLESMTVPVLISH
ncbi:MAG: universal stress protein [Geminicoccaceae bacterium]|nr:universal stress protein [Geminicoccaceae bacterium]